MGVPDSKKNQHERSVPLVSVIVLTYNSAQWLPRCLSSIRTQTIASELEVLVVDNASKDDTVAVARRELDGFNRAKVIRNSQNLGFCEGNNVGAREARGKYLFFLNPDAWLEQECLELLIKEVEMAGAKAATPVVLNYEDDSIQEFGYAGFDFFGFPTHAKFRPSVRHIFMASGCALLVERKLFFDIGEFDPELFMYADDWDLCWRVWIMGESVIAVPTARAHHRGAVAVNPQGGTKVLEFRTSDRKRFLANRNGLVVLAKNARNILLVLVLIQLVYLFIESCAISLLFGRLDYLKEAYWKAVKEWWRLLPHIAQERKRINSFRQRNDLWFLRFLRLRPNRWFEIQRLLRFGIPKIDRVGTS